MANRILLVDDEDSIVLSFKKDFEDEGYEVTTASNGETAVMLLKHNIFHLIVTDLVMPGIDGMTVLEEARKLYPDIGAIILTGYGDMNSAIKALRLGADDYLLKPCNSEELLVRAQHCLEKRRALHLNRLYEKLLPVCMFCKSIRDDTGTDPGKGKWFIMEEYLKQKADVDLSHSCCPGCYEQHKDKWIKF